MLTELRLCIVAGWLAAVRSDRTCCSSRRPVVDRQVFCRFCLFVRRVWARQQHCPLPLSRDCCLFITSDNGDQWDRNRHSSSSSRGRQLVTRQTCQAANADVRCPPVHHSGSPFVLLNDYTSILIVIWYINYSKYIASLIYRRGENQNRRKKENRKSEKIRMSLSDGYQRAVARDNVKTSK